MYFVAKPNEEAKAFIQAAGLIDENQMKAVGTLVFDLKNYNLWDKMKVIYPMVGQAGVSSSFEVNLKNPNTFRGTFSSGWTFASTGINGNGVNSYMTTGLNASTVVSGGGNFFVYTNNNGTNLPETRDLGVIAGASENGCVVNFGGASYSLQGLYTSPAQFITTPFSVSNLGFFQANMFGTTNSIVRNNSILTTNTNGFTYLNDTMYLGAEKTSGSSVPVTSTDRRYCFAGVSDGLSNADLLSFYTAVQRFQTTLGRQV